MRILYVLSIVLFAGCGAKEDKEIKRESCKEINSGLISLISKCSGSDQYCHPVYRFGYNYCDNSQSCFVSKGGNEVLKLAEAYGCTCKECD